MADQKASQRYGYALIEEDPHRKISGNRCDERLLGVPKHRHDLFFLHTREPLDEIVDTRPCLQILK